VLNRVMAEFIDKAGAHRCLLQGVDSVGELNLAVGS